MITTAADTPDMPIVEAADQVNTQQRQVVVDRCGELRILKGRRIGRTAGVQAGHRRHAHAPPIDIARQLETAAPGDPTTRWPATARPWRTRTCGLSGHDDRRRLRDSDAVVMVTSGDQYINPDWGSRADATPSGWTAGTSGNRPDCKRLGYRYATTGCRLSRHPTIRAGRGSRGSTWRNGCPEYRTFNLENSTSGRPTPTRAADTGRTHRPDAAPDRPPARRHRMLQEVNGPGAAR